MSLVSKMKLFWVVLLLDVICKCQAANFCDDYATPSCDPNACQLPDCACTDTEPNVPVNKRPQIVYLTFDDAMTKQFDDQFYNELFMPDASGNYKYTNPNGCPIKATFFVNGKNNDFPTVCSVENSNWFITKIHFQNYLQTHKYWRHYHEIGAHSITHQTDLTYWANMNETSWYDEMVGVRKMIAKFAKIPESDIKGIRAPFLQAGGDDMLKMMAENDFLYDASAPSRAYGYTNLQNGRWPFTYDYHSDMDCQIEPCPKCSFPGIWSQPICILKMDA